MIKKTARKTTTTAAPVAVVTNEVVNTVKAGPGRPPIPTMTIKVDKVSPKGASFRMDVAKEIVEKGDAPVQSVYLNRAALKLAGVKDGHMPTLVEFTFRVLKTAPEPVATPAAK